MSFKALSLVIYQSLSDRQGASQPLRSHFVKNTAIFSLKSRKFRYNTTLRRLLCFFIVTPFRFISAESFNSMRIFYYAIFCWQSQVFCPLNFKEKVKHYVLLILKISPFNNRLGIVV